MADDIDALFFYGNCVKRHVVLYQRETDTPGMWMS